MVRAMVTYLLLFTISVTTLSAGVYIAQKPHGVSLVTRLGGVSALAGVGASAEVEENRYNTLAKQLEQKEQSLKEKEQALEEREEQLGRRADAAVLLSMGIGIVLLIVVSINFYLDWRRGDFIRKVHGDKKHA
jgi:chromosome segregation ATPase